MQGTGTQADPYQITNVNDFMDKIQETGAYLKLMNDLDFNDSNYYDITQSYTILCEEIEGDNHSITNIFINNIDLLFTVGKYNGSSENICPKFYNITFEILCVSITKECQIFVLEGRDNITFRNCTFNVKKYLFYGSSPMFTFGPTSYILNCIFNIQIIYPSNNTGGGIIISHGTQSWGTCYIKFCEFNINYKWLTVTSSTSANSGNVFDRRWGSDATCFMYNAIFVTKDLPGTETKANSNGGTIFTGRGDACVSCYVVYKNIGTGTVTDVLSNNYPTGTAFSGGTTCFYDYESANGALTVDGTNRDLNNMHGLTTAQCKDASYLESIGFIINRT